MNSPRSTLNDKVIASSAPVNCPVIQVSALWKNCACAGDEKASSSKKVLKTVNADEVTLYRPENFVIVLRKPSNSRRKMIAVTPNIEIQNVEMLIRLGLITTSRNVVIVPVSINKYG